MTKYNTMKRFVNIFFCLTILFLGSQNMFAQSLLDELQQLYRIDRLPQYLKTGVVEQFSSYDTTGKNDDGFSGAYSFIRMEGENQVVAEMKGPGVINRIHTPTPTSDIISFFFDGEKEPRLSLPLDELFTSNRFPFLDPVCGHEVGGFYCYLPIPYRKSCKVIYKGKMLFWQLQYRTYPENTKISSYSTNWTDQEKEALNKAVDLWREYDTNYINKLYKNIHEKTTIIRIKPGDTQPVFEINTGGRIVGIEVEGIDKLAVNENRLVLKAKWDKEDNWAIQASIKDLFGYFFGKKSMRSLLGGTSGNTSYIYYPMPFLKSALMELEFLDSPGSPSSDAELTLKIFYINKPKEENEGKFYTYWRREINPPEGQPYTIMPKVLGRGHYVGTILLCQGLRPGSTSYFEGDDVATIDGKIRLHGTGSEDFFNGGYYLIPDRWDTAHSLPTHGCLGYVNALSRTGGFRHYFSDKLSFKNNFMLTIEHGPEGNRSLVDYRSVAFYYADNALVEQEPCSASMTAYPQPTSLKYLGYLLNVQAFRRGILVNGKRIGNELVLTMQPSDSKKPMLVKFNLDAPTDGRYKLYCSYFRSPSSAEVRFMLRQVPLTDWKNLYNNKEEYVDREFLGVLNVIEGSCTVTVLIRGNECNQFNLNEIILEKE